MASATYGLIEMASMAIAASAAGRGLITAHERLYRIGNTFSRSSPGRGMTCTPTSSPDAPCGSGAGIGRGLDRSDVTANERRNQARIDLLPADENHVCGLEHRICGFNHADQPTGLDHAKRVADFTIWSAVSWFGSRHVGDYPTSLRSRSTTNQGRRLIDSRRSG